MIIGKKRLKNLSSSGMSKGRGAIFWKKFRGHKLAVWSLRLLYLLVFIAIFADFIANDKPLVCKINTTTYFPVADEIATKIGLKDPTTAFMNKDWYGENYDWVVWPPIPYAATTIDPKNMQFAHPFKKQNIESLQFRHWLGTNQIGKDVTAGLIAGNRIALIIGIMAMGIAFIIGTLVGGIAGFYGDNQYRISIIRLCLSIVGIVLGSFWLSAWINYQPVSIGWLMKWGTGLVFIILIYLAVKYLSDYLEKRRILHRRFNLALDLLIMRVIEVINSIPGLLLILAIIPLLQSRSIFNIMVIIGLIGWTGIARFVRAELLKIRELEYIQAGKTLGFTHWRLLFFHALPNALGPVLVAIAFGVANAILIEAYLSFLGFGLPLEEVTWGRQLNEARSATKAWWLALFPGIAIFLTVSMFNLLGEGLADTIGTNTSRRE